MKLLQVTTSLLAFPFVWLQAEERPNIIVIMCDDMGYSDLGCFGSEIRTPNIDRLAANGLCFTQFYNCGRSCPTRASLMTGLYAHQAGVGEMVNDRCLAGYRGDLSLNSVTIAEVMKNAGYHTYMSGKWHVTDVPYGEKCRMPLGITGRCREDSNDFTGRCTVPGAIGILVP